MDQVEKKEVAATVAQWKLLAEALVRKGLGGKNHSGRKLSEWRGVLAKAEVKFMHAEYAIAVVSDHFQVARIFICSRVDCAA